jgi:hypothetical protein
MTAYPIAWMLANPLIYAWTPTYKDFLHGTYWGDFWAYTLCTSVTGLAFSLTSGRIGKTVDRYARRSEDFPGRCG